VVQIRSAMTETAITLTPAMRAGSLPAMTAKGTFVPTGICRRSRGGRAALDRAGSLAFLSPISIPPSTPLSRTLQQTHVERTDDDPNLKVVASRGT